MVDHRSSRVIDRGGKNQIRGGVFRWTLALSAVTLFWYIFGLFQLGRRIEGDVSLHGDYLHDLYPSTGHRIDDGRWSIGLYRGETSPLALQPIDVSPWRSDDDALRAWPVSNPVFTKQHVEDAEIGPRHGTFVSDPFLFQASSKLAALLGTSKGTGDDVKERLHDEDGHRKKSTLDGDARRQRQVKGSTTSEERPGEDGESKNQLDLLVKGPIYLFFQTKNVQTRKGDIGVAVSNNGGLKWTYLGTALSSKNTSFSYPYIFEWKENVYLLPEAKDSGALTLYKATLSNFPFEWVEEKTILSVPVVNPSIVEWNELWYLFVTDDMERKQQPSFSSSADEIKLHIYHADTPLGPWMSHFLNPVMVGNEGSGARMAGRMVKHEGKLYRFGQDGQGLYGKDVLAFRVDALTPKDFEQTRVKFQAGRIRKGTGAWNSQRRHHVDMNQLSDGSWLGVLDGDYFQDQHDVNKEQFFHVQYYLVFLVGAVFIPSILRYPKVHSCGLASWGNRSCGWQSMCIILGTMGVTLVLVFSATSSWRCQRQYYNAIVDASNTTHELRIPVEGAYSKYTVIVDVQGSMSRFRMKKRKKLLSSIIKHYASCPSTSEVVFMHSNGDSSMMEYLEKTFAHIYRPWIRNETLTKIYQVGDFSITTRAALLLSRGMIVSCKDLEILFALWRRDPDVLFGSNTFVREDRASPGYFNLLSSGLYLMDFENLKKIDGDESFNTLKSIADGFDGCDDVLLSLMWTQSSTAPAPLQHFRPTRSMDLLPRGKTQSQTNLFKYKNECVDTMAQQDDTIDQQPTHQIDVHNQIPPSCT